jgi:hypothetical protein
MPLRGTLDTMALQDLLQWLGTARKTGLVTLSQGTITKKIFIETGLVTGSVSNDPAEFIGQFLLSYGRITEEQLRDALASKEKSPEYLGTHLVRMGAISEIDLTRLLALKTEESIYSIFGWDSANFVYEDCTPEGSPFPVALRIDDILLKGARRFDEMAHIRAVIPSSALVPRRTQEPLPPAILQSPNLKRLADAVDGSRSVAAIALHTHTSDFLASKFLYEALRAGLVEVAAPSEPVSRKVSPDLVQAAERLFQAGDYEAVLTLCEKLDIDGDSDLRGMLRQCEEKFVEHAYANSLSPERIPVLSRPPNEMLAEKLSPEEYFLISRIDGVWDIRSIVAVSPLREVDALHVIGRLMKRGLISLKAHRSAV